ncbi:MULTISPECIES: hypothetical protein [Streptomyces]|nr:MULTISPECIES: hypothetical protein [Streptomyces]
MAAAPYRHLQGVQGEVGVREVVTCQPTTMREKTSMTNAAYTQPENVRM